MKILTETRNFIGSILFNVFFWTYFIILALVLMPIYLFLPYKIMRIICYRSVAKVMHCLLRIFLGIRYEITGREHLSGQFIIGSNHQSMWETIAIPALMPNPGDMSVVLKKELQDAPIFGYHMSKIHNIAIDRSKPVSALKTLVSMGHEAKKAGDSILIFITGTRSEASGQANGGQSHKVGVYALYKNLGLPVIPCNLDSGKCWGRNSFFKRGGTIHLDFKAPIQPGLSREEFDARMNDVFGRKS